jgi:predicted secreted protein
MALARIKNPEQAGIIIPLPVPVFIFFLWERLPAGRGHGQFLYQAV